MNVWGFTAMKDWESFKLYMIGKILICKTGHIILANNGIV